jgi:HK97 family phage major capsid protein
MAAMFSRMPPASQESPAACWLVHGDLIGQLAQLVFTSGARPLTPGAHIYIPRMASGNRTPLLLGLAVVTIEASPLGTVGDIILGDFSRYLLMAPEVKPTVSADVAFIGEVEPCFMRRRPHLATGRLLRL